MAKLGLKNSNELHREVTKHFIYVLRERNFKTKATELEVIYRFRVGGTYKVLAKVKPGVSVERAKELTTNRALGHQKRYDELTGSV